MVVTERPSACAASRVTRLGGGAVHQDGAGAAQTGLAADVAAGEAQRIAQEVDQQGTRLHGALVGGGRSR